MPVRCVIMSLLLVTLRWCARGEHVISTYVGINYKCNKYRL